MKNVIKNTIYKIGKIYIGNDISELNTYLKNIENDLLKLNKNWKIDDFSNKVVEELEKNRVLEIAIYNLKKSNNNIICKKILESAETIFFALSPASIKIFVLGVSTNKLFPVLPLYKLQNLNILIPILH